MVELLPWDDLVNNDAAGSRVVRLLRGLIAYLNLIWTGTLFRYAIANQRYLLFALAPLAEAMLLGAVSWWAAFFLASRTGWPPALEVALAVVGGFGLFLVLLEWPGRRWRIYQALDDWILSLDYIYRKRPDLEARLEQFAKRIAAEATGGKAEEIVVLGHSLGATFAIDAMARALASDPDLGRHGRSLSLVTVGATIPKCALHPGAHELRARVKSVADEPSIYWVEYQSRADPDQLLPVSSGPAAADHRKERRARRPTAHSPGAYQRDASAGDLRKVSASPHAHSLSIRHGQRAALYL